MSNSNGLDTFPKIIKNNCEKYGSKKVAIRHKKFGIWKSFTWKDFYEYIKFLSLGLMELGLKRGDKVFILADNVPEWLFTAYAVQSAGGIFVGGYPDAAPNELKYYVNHCDAEIVFAENQEQVDKMLSLRDAREIPKVKKVIYWEPKGMWSYNDPLIMSFGELMKLGEKAEGIYPGAFEQKIEQGKGNGMATFSYTSGTTGVPKCAMLTHQGQIDMAKSLLRISPLYEEDNVLSYLPLAWMGDFVVILNRALISGSVINFPETSETVEQDLREIGISVVVISPKLLEARAKDVETRIREATPFKKLWYHFFMPVGYKVANFKLQGKPSPVFWKILDGVAYLMLFRMILDRLGFLKCREIYTAGAVISPEIYTFYHAIHANLKCLYGLTEAGGTLTCHLDDDIQKETVGKPLPGVEIKISEGEVLLKSPGMFSGYYKNEEATRKAIREGWYHTGDSGLINPQGHLIVFDRMGELIKLTDGTKVSPQYIESRLRISPYIAEAMVVGDNQPYLASIIILNFNIAGKWAEDNSVRYTTYADISQKKEVIDLISQELRKFNATFSEKLRIKKFLLLHKALDADDAELTRIRKLRRSHIEKEYGDIIKALFENKTEVLADSTIVYQDGKKQSIKASLQINTISG